MKWWDRFPSWEGAEKTWDQGAQEAEKNAPVKKLRVLPQMPGITEETAKHLKWKSFVYMLRHDTKRQILRHVLKRPFRYAYHYLRSLLKKRAYTRDEDFFFYGLPSVEAFVKQVHQPDSLLVFGFSYCQKPHACPSGRFTDQCIQDPDHPVCRQCPIGKLMHALPSKKCIPLIIPTVHYIGNKMFEISDAHPEKKLHFCITACEMTLEMFGDWGNMIQAKGIGVRLDGRICNTMRAFELSEKGIKPGLTVLTDKSEARMLQLVKLLREDVSF